MTPERDPLDDILDSIADGTPVDWKAAKGSTTPQDWSRIDTLNDVFRIADFNRTLQQRPSDFGLTVDTSEKWGTLLLLERLSGNERSELYRAWDVRLQREVALKLLHAGSDSAREAALLHEGRAAAKIRHPNVVTIYGIDAVDGRVGFWMELLRGVTLEQEITVSGPLESARAIQLGMEIGSALEAVHAAGLLHRDVKPSNIVRDGIRYVLADFGLGQRAAAIVPADGSSGTPMYMAPELFRGSAPSDRSDLYALGLTLWYALAGRHPFRADSLNELTAAVEGGPDALSDLRPELSGDLVAVIERAIARHPEDRFASAGQVVAALQHLAPAPRSGRRVGPWLAAGAVALGIAATILVLNRPTHPPVDTPATAKSTDGMSMVQAAPVYDVEATFVKHTNQGRVRLFEGNGVEPGDRLSLETKVSRPAWVYVLDEDERGEHYLLFPQPRFDQKNPIPAGAMHVLPGTIEGRENAWTVTSRGGREYLLVVISPEPVSDLESELGRIPPAEPGRPITYAAVGSRSLETLRGVGGIQEIPAGTDSAGSQIFSRFQVLAGRESDVHGIWVRQVSLANP